MQKLSQLWYSLWQNPLHEEEVKVNISGVDYGHESIVSLSTSGGMFATPDIGNCSARQIDLEILNPGVIPRQAEIKVYIRLVLDDQMSEWVQQGVFFVSSRNENKITRSLTIHGFDAMLKAGQVWLTDDYKFDNWPKTETEAARDIASRMGIELDPRTNLANMFRVDYPVDENGDMTMIEILEGIAVANAGNWIITDEGNLLLIKLGDIPTDTNYLVTEYGDAITLGGVRILVG